MLDQLLELSRKAAESSLQMQQVMFKHWTQDGLPQPSAAAGLSADWAGTMKKRWLEMSLDVMNKHRESVDAAYRAGIQAIEQLAKVSEAKSAEEGVRATEEIWRKLFDSYKGQAETQFRELQTMAEKTFEVVRNAGSGHASP